MLVILVHVVVQVMRLVLEERIPAIVGIMGKAGECEERS